jgi:hypothetical protein
MFSFFLSQFVFRRQPPEFFVFKKIRQMTAGQNEIHPI